MVRKVEGVELGGEIEGVIAVSKLFNIGDLVETVVDEFVVEERNTVIALNH